MGTIAFTLERNDLEPAIRRALAQVKPATPVLRAMGTTFKSITEGTFNSVGASYRPEPWKPKIDGSPSNLQKSTTMAKAFHLEVSATKATLSNSTIYSRIHQLGGVIKPKNKPVLVFTIGGKTVFAKKVTIPARPFFPVANGQLTAKAQEKVVKAAERVIRKALGGRG